MGQDLRALRRRCEARLRELSLPVPFDLDGFCQDLARRRHRPLRLRPVVAPVAPYGVWVATPTSDYIFFEEDTSPLHRLHIILHELSHVICEHYPVPFQDVSISVDLFPDLRPDTIRLLLQRTVYSTNEEREAELLATLLLARITQSTPRPGSSDDSEAREVLHRLVSSLEDDDKRQS